MKKTKTSPVTNRAVIYARVSTKEQLENLSISTQESKCRALCKEEGLDVVRVFQGGESAKTDDRQALQSMLAYCADSRNRVGHLVFYSMSRFARNIEDTVQLRRALRKAGVRLHSATEPIDESAGGMLVANINAVIAEFDNMQKAERTCEGMLACLEAGGWPFRAPPGYLKTRSATNIATLASDPILAPVIAQAFLDVSRGVSQQVALRTATAGGLATLAGRQLTAQAFGRMLRNPRYCGRTGVENWGFVGRGDYVPIVDEATFDRVQHLLSPKSLRAPRMRKRADFPLKQVVRCGACARPLTAGWSTGRRSRYAYYRCRNAPCRVNARKEVLEAAFRTLLEQHSVPDPVLAELRVMVGAVLAERAKGSQETLVRLNCRRRAVDKRRHKLEDVYLSKTVIDDDTYKRQHERINEELQRIDDELELAAFPEIDVDDVLRLARNLLNDLPAFWESADMEKKQRLQAALFPNGVPYSNAGFGTAESPLLTTLSAMRNALDAQMASPAGFEPASPT